MTIRSAELVFVPGLGFRPANGLMLRAPVTHHVEEWSVTIDRVVADGAATQVAITIHGPFKWKGERFKQPDVDYSGLVRARDESGELVSSEGRRCSR